VSGLFLSFEGGEASGKSAQARALADWLRANGHEVILTREPGGTPLAERIRDVLLHAEEVALAPEAQALLFSAARGRSSVRRSPPGRSSSRTASTTRRSRTRATATARTCSGS
jgi:dTMP kinase